MSCLFLFQLSSIVWPKPSLSWCITVFSMYPKSHRKGLKSIRSGVTDTFFNAVRPNRCTSWVAQIVKHKPRVDSSYLTLPTLQICANPLKRCSMESSFTFVFFVMIQLTWAWSCIIAIKKSVSHKQTLSVCMNYKQAQQAYLFTWKSFSKINCE